jgi:peptide/nickel transport system permease protein
VLISFASYTRYTRSSMLEVMNADYIRTARAKGLTERVVVVRHAFRNALIPLATIIPIDIAAVFGGAVLTERIFSWRGMGTMFLEALRVGDPGTVMGYFLVTAVLAIGANIVADLIYAWLDPRIRVTA